MIAPKVVDEIRRLLAQRKLSQRKIAKRLRISRGTVGAIAAEVEQTVRMAFEDVDTVEVSLVWDPPWTFERLSDKARKALGFES